MNPTSGTTNQIIELASPVKVGKGGDRRYGMLIARASRLQLVTDRGVELDVDRSELMDAKAADSMPRIAFTVRGEAHRYWLVAGRPSHDGSGLVAGMKGQPHYAQQASAVSRWNEWLHPRSPEQIAQLERHRQAAERAQRFASEEVAAPDRMQTPVWHTHSHAIAQLQLAGDVLILTSTDGSVVRLGPARGAAVSWAGSGRKSTLQLQTGAGNFTFGFQPPKQKGGAAGGSGTDADAIIFVVALPLLASFSITERRAIKQRIRRWREALPGAPS